jgi:peptidoglycan hydrolase-like protein with peptidoglycan-binding domain
MTESTLKSIQEALIERGYDPGKPDGKIGNKTKNAIAKFQKDNNLATGGITYETLQALKLSH